MDGGIAYKVLLVWRHCLHGEWKEALLTKSSWFSLFLL